MKQPVPFYKSRPTPANPNGIHCVENCLQMILGYFEPDKQYSLADMEKITGKQPEKATWEMKWSIWLVEHGYEVKYYTTFDYAAFLDKGIDYIREAYGDETATWQADNSDVEAARQLTTEYLTKVEVIKKSPTVKDISAEMAQGFLVKASVNQKMINGDAGYIGHSVVVTDIDDENVWFHDPGLPAFENRKVSKKLFQKAMDSFGGEIDAIKKA